MLKAALQIGHAAQELDFVVAPACAPTRRATRPNDCGCPSTPPPSAASAAMRLPNSTSARLVSLSASIVASTQATILRLNSTCSRTCQSSTRATKRFQRLHQRVQRTAGARVHGADGGHFAERGVARMHQRHQIGQRDVRTLPRRSSGLRARTRSRTSCRMAISSALSTRRLPSAPGGRDQGSSSRRAATNRRSPWRATRLGGLHHVVQHAVDHVLLKDSQVAILVQVHLVRLQLQTQLIGHVAQHDLAEIRQARSWGRRR